MCLLARRDRSGYELALFTSPPRNFLLWSAKHSQIYPELAKLTATGLIDFSRVQQESRPDKKVYHLTNAGRQVLEKWVLVAPRPVSFRQELALKSHASWLADPRAAAALFEEQAAIAQDQIDLIEQHKSRLEDRYGEKFPPPPSNPLFGTYANIRFAIDSRRQLIDWCRWMETELNSAASDTKKAS